MSDPRRLVVAVVAVLSATACSLSDDEQTAADSIANALVTDNSPKSVEDSAECVAEKWVGEVGTGALEDDGLIDERSRVRASVLRAAKSGKQPVSEEVAEGYAAAWVACVDFDAVSLDLEDSHPDASEEDLDEYADCLKEIDDDLWRDGITALWTGDRSSPARVGLMRETADCRQELARAEG